MHEKFDPFGKVSFYNNSMCAGQIEAYAHFTRGGIR